MPFADLGTVSRLTSYPRSTARWKESSCRGITLRTPCKQSTVGGSSIILYANLELSVSSLEHSIIGRP